MPPGAAPGDREPRRTAGPLLLALAAATLLAATASDLGAFERLQRKFDIERGLPFSEVDSVRQDSRGFLWLATGGGLFRYDGMELRPWPRESFRLLVKDVATGPGGEVLFEDYLGRLFEVSGESVRPVEGPDRKPLLASTPPVLDRRDILWVATKDGLWSRSPGGEWEEFPLPRLESKRPYTLVLSEEGEPVVITGDAIWRIGGTREAVLVARVHDAGKAIVRRDGSAVVLFSDGRVAETKEGSERELYRIAMRPIDIVERRGTLWIAYDAALVALRPGEGPEVLGPSRGIPSGGPLLIDQEGSLWVGTFRGLIQFPSPETVAWGAADGMASSGPRRLAESAEGIWVDSWGGLTLLHRKGGAFEPERVPGTGTSAVCVGSDGRAWSGSKGRLLERRNGRFVVHPFAGLREVDDCAPGADGRVWLSTDGGLFVVGSESPAEAPGRIPDPDPAEGAARPRCVLEDSRGSLWLSSGESICRGDARRAGAGGDPAWACARAEGAGRILGFAELPSGDLWAATLLAGVYALDAGDRWAQLPFSRGLPTRVIRKVRASPSGGAWIISYGTLVRVERSGDSGNGWEIVERPSPWHGLMISDAEDILEEASGDLWITSLAGLIHIPADVRRAAPPVPRVELVDVLSDGRPLEGRDGVPLRHNRNRLELRFAGLSFRDPALLRYQVRLGGDAPWLEASTRPYFQFVDLPPGRYQAEIRASLDGRRWSPTTAALSFTVLPPFWRTGWFMTLIAVSLASSAWALYRYRVSRLLELERMRTRIAADLHDDIGSSLSRIALQSDLVMRPGTLSGRDSERVLSDIGETARSLVDSMSDIVWSIDPRRDDLDSLVTRLRQFALGILEPLGVAFAIDLSEGASGQRLAPETRRHLYLILKEAVHNIARHSLCRRATVSLQVQGGRLQAEVRDDGRGFDTSAAESAAPVARGGRGIPSMKGRVALMGGTISIESSPGRGTILRITCPTAGKRA